MINFIIVFPIWKTNYIFRMIINQLAIILPVYMQEEKCNSCLWHNYVTL